MTLKDLFSPQALEFGDRVRIGENTLLLAQVAPNVCQFIDINSGNRWGAPVDVGCPNQINEIEASKLLGGDFELERAELMPAGDDDDDL